MVLNIRYPFTASSIQWDKLFLGGSIENLNFPLNWKNIASKYFGKILRRETHLLNDIIKTT